MHRQAAREGRGPHTDAIEENQDCGVQRGAQAIVEAAPEVAPNQIRAGPSFFLGFFIINKRVSVDIHPCDKQSYSFPTDRF
jgi:hypothetical protein